MGAACRRLLATWRPLATYWRLLATTGDRWLPVRAHPHIAFSLATTGDHWRPLATTGNLATGDHWRLGNLLATYWRLSLATWQPRAQDSYKTVPFIIVVCFPKLFTDYTKITLVHLTLICEQHRLTRPTTARQALDRHRTSLDSSTARHARHARHARQIPTRHTRRCCQDCPTEARQRPDSTRHYPDTGSRHQARHKPDISPT